MIDYERLERELVDLRATFGAARPFPHLVVEDLFEPSGLKEVLARFPSMDEMGYTHKNAREHKTSLATLDRVDPLVRAAFDELNGPRFVGWLGDVTQIPDLLVDPENLGGGLHQSGDGMYLDVHADFNRHIRTRWFRRLNVIVYLNEGWTADMGGVLELWPPDMSAPAVSIVPAFNRCVIFATTPSSFHGYDVIRSGDTTRRSLATYYYTEAPPPEYAGRDHSTLFRRRPGQGRRWVPGGAIRTWRARIRRGIEIARHGR